MPLHCGGPSLQSFTGKVKCPTAAHWARMSTLIGTVASPTSPPAAVPAASCRSPSRSDPLSATCSLTFADLATSPRVVVEVLLLASSLDADLHLAVFAGHATGDGTRASRTSVLNAASFRRHELHDRFAAAVQRRGSLIEAVDAVPLHARAFDRDRWER